MQRRTALRQERAQNNFETYWDEVFKKPEDEKLLYTASVNFLKKRLEDKTVSFPHKQKEVSKSCCSIVTYAENKTRNSAREQSLHSSQSEESDSIDETSLSMHQVLPFPKTNKASFFTRLKNNFRKYRRTASLTEYENADDTESSKFISNFKFPRCDQLSSAHSSWLFQINEENLNGSVKINIDKKNTIQ